MNVQNQLRTSSLMVLLFSGATWAAIPLTGPCDPDFGPTGSCQTAPKESKIQAPRATKQAPAVQTAPQLPAPAAAGSKNSIKSEARPEPAPQVSATVDEPARQPAAELPEPTVPLLPPAQRTQ